MSSGAATASCEHNKIKMMKDAFPFPVARIGIIGGGQLGRMMVKAAKRLGCTCVVLDPTPNSPAGQVAGHQIVGHYHDPNKLRELTDACDVTTFDIEDIDALTLQLLEAEGHPIHPSPELLATIQDKLHQKQLLDRAEIPTAEFLAVSAITPHAFADFGYPLVQKARRGGYDGRGVAVLRDPSEFATHLPVPSFIERLVDAQKEIAILVARAKDGDCRCYPVVEMRFVPGQNLLDMLLAPADLSPAIVAQAEGLAVRTVEAFGGVGIFGVEMFLTRDDQVLVNEVAPRTHNSGHYTIEACVTDQFEQHLRAVLGLPLGSTELLSPAAMINLLGAPGHSGRPIIKGMAAALAIPGVCLHIYGKSKTTPYRKMGHVTVLDRDIENARIKAERVRGLITIAGEDPQ